MTIPQHCMAWEACLDFMFPNQSYIPHASHASPLARSFLSRFKLIGFGDNCIFWMLTFLMTVDVWFQTKLSISATREDTLARHSVTCQKALVGLSWRGETGGDRNMQQAVGIISHSRQNTVHPSYRGQHWPWLGDVAFMLYFHVISSADIPGSISQNYT